MSWTKGMGSRECDTVTNESPYDLPKEVYEAIHVINDWQPEGKWNQRMRRKALKALLRITIYGTRVRE